MHAFAKPQLDAFRKAVLDPHAGKALDKAIAAVESAGYAIHGASRKTVPRGFDASHPRAAMACQFTDHMHGMSKAYAGARRCGISI